MRLCFPCPCDHAVLDFAFHYFSVTLDPIEFVHRDAPAEPQ